MESLNILWSWWFVSRTIFFCALLVKLCWQKNSLLQKGATGDTGDGIYLKFLHRTKLGFLQDQGWFQISPIFQMKLNFPLKSFADLVSRGRLKRCRSISGAMNLNCGQECLEFSASILSNHKIESCRILLFALSFRIICQKTANTWMVDMWDAK